MFIEGGGEIIQLASTCGKRELSTSTYKFCWWHNQEDSWVDSYNSKMSNVLWSMSIGLATPSSIFKGAKNEKQASRCHPLRCLGSYKNDDIGKCRYYVIFIDDLSWHILIYQPMCGKSKIFSYFCNFKSLMEKGINQTISYLQSNGWRKTSMRNSMLSSIVVNSCSCTHKTTNGVA